MSSDPLRPAPRDADWFDVERFRTSSHRILEVRRVERSAVILGSTQLIGTIDSKRAELSGLDVLRRRSGGGAVHVSPRDPIWCDLWVPRDDPLWEDDVSWASWWVGEWWVTALRELGAPELSVHRGGMVGGAASRAVCFAGLGPGEVVHDQRKVVGVAQWRCRQGTLFHAAGYRRWAPAQLASLLADRDSYDVEVLDGVAEGIVPLLEREVAPAEIVESLLEALPDDEDWELHRD